MFYIANKNSILLTVDGETNTLDRSFPQYEAIKKAASEGDWQKASDLIDTGRAIHSFGEGAITVSNGIVNFNVNGEVHVVDNSLTKRIIQMIGDGETVLPMVNFLTNLLKNPSCRAVKETYGFLQQNDLPITEDGCFIAYKNVSETYMDKHSNTFRNYVGDVCEMPRFKVCDDQNITCSSGLHFCSIDYLKGFWGTSGHTMAVKIDPADVVSIPTDYNNAKGRCCKYTVMSEIKFKDGEVSDVFDKSVWKAELPVEEVKEPTTNELLQQLIAIQTK